MADLFTADPALDAATMYEANIRQYSAAGSFAAFTDQLPRLKSMGVNVIWLMPIHPIGKVKRKGTLGSYYSIADYKAINPEFGNAADLRKLISTAHALGQRILLDWVANHTAWDNVWTIDHPEYFVRDEHGNFKPPFDWDDVIQIDHNSAPQQAAMIEAMGFWIREFEIDGFRADLAHLTPLQFWKDARRQLSPLKKNLVWLAETEEPSYHEAFDISFTWEWMHLSEKIAKQQAGVADAIALLRKYKEEFPFGAKRMFFTSNHDENSWNGTEYEKYGVYAKALAAFSFTYPGLPLIYSGQELPNNKRLKFFDKDAIEWTDEIHLHDFYERLSALRARHANLNRATTEVRFIEQLIPQNVLGYFIEDSHEMMFALFNFSGEAQTVCIDISTAVQLQNIFTGAPLQFSDKPTIHLEPGEFLIAENIGA